MANEQNLIPQAHVLTVEEASKGGKKSAESRRNKKLLRECIDYLLEKDDKMMLDDEGNPMSGAEKLAYNLFVKALAEPDTAKAAKAFEVLRDTAGQKPVEKVMVADVDADVINEVEAMVTGETD